MALCRFRYRNDVQWGRLVHDRIMPLDVADVMRVFSGREPDGLRALEQSAHASIDTPIALGRLVGPEGALLAPVLADHEIWAAGVTYESSKFARMSESESDSDLYARVYTADRPELFFKATASRVVGPGDQVRIRADSRWNVPEPELTALIAGDGRILGYTIGNDMSSRDIEGENALYLPQAKVYRGSSALGPVVVPAESVDARSLAIRLIVRRESETVFEGVTNTSRMRRTVEELAEWLFRENDFPHGVHLLTGTGIVPPESFSLLSGDRIVIEIDGIGSLENTVA